MKQLVVGVLPVSEFVAEYVPAAVKKRVGLVAAAAADVDAAAAAAAAAEE
jgi:hypothetical protein